MRAGIVVEVTPEDRVRLERIVGDRNTPQKHSARARVILATAEDCGTLEIVRRSGLSKPVVWRWQERFMHEGVDGLLRHKTRPPGKRPLPGETVIGRCMQRHRHEEFIRFLNAIERAVPAGKLIHAIADNYATHKHPKVRAWLARHPRWTFHFTPTSCSWLNAVENFFATLTKRRLKRGVFCSIVDSRPPSAAISPSTTTNPSPSSGRQTQNASWLLSNAGSKR